MASVAIQVVWKTVVAELLEHLGPEIPAAIMEFVKQASTKDGWTNAEKRAYVIGRVEGLRDQQIGPAMADHVIDICLNLALHWLKTKEKTPPVDVPPANPADIYFKIINVNPESQMVVGDKLYKSSTKELWFATHGPAGVGVPGGFYLVKEY